ncbi:TylF/MycF/NovP-related O-methyltransferase [Xanthobacter sp. V4C-4]|uniref:TylF/MycF/NovP-related O-methyltransferase n=1 Tax=Xanthobacter cornucopiae TaxID=3119924 RepID=UPI003727734F
MNTGPSPVLSVVVASYEMARELRRTLISLSPGYQRGLDVPYEVIVVDNGSAEPPRLEEFADLGLDLKILLHPPGSISPVAALNRGLAASRGTLICSIIDGARMASPGLLAASVAAAGAHLRPVVYTASMMLGFAPQWLAHETGYDQAVEDRLLASIGWPADGYRLFEIANGLVVQPGALVWYAPGGESNAITLTRAMWDQLGGYCEAFQTAGGGCASHDLFSRAAALDGSQIIVIGGEATFHQYHRRSASTATPDAGRRMVEFSREYFRIRGRTAKPVRKPYWLFETHTPPLAAQTPEAAPDGLSRRYLHLLQNRLLNTGAREVEARLRALEATVRAAGRDDLIETAKASVPRQLKRVVGAYTEGMLLDQTPPSGLTMTGRRRLEQLTACLHQILDEAIPGDLVECGVWRGGSAIMMAGVLAARNVSDRKVWVADSFAGLPPADSQRDYGFDSAAVNAAGLAVSLESVRANFEELELLSDTVRFLPGWFKDTLPEAPIARIAVLRLDGDLYASTMDALNALYAKVVPGGFVIIDDYALPSCADAVRDFRAAHAITEPLQRIDYTGVFWRKTQAEKDLSAP